MKTRITREAEKAIHRFKNLSVWDVEDIAEAFIETAEEYCKISVGKMCFELYNEENDVTLFCESEDGSELTVLDVRRGNLAGAF